MFALTDPAERPWLSWGTIGAEERIEVDHSCRTLGFAKFAALLGSCLKITDFMVTL